MRLANKKKANLRFFSAILRTQPAFPAGYFAVETGFYAFFHKKTIFAVNSDTSFASKKTAPAGVIAENYS